MNGRFLVTGGSGFVGSALVRRLVDNRHNAIVLSRRSHVSPFDVVKFADLCELDFPSSYFIGVEVVIHCAARVHFMAETLRDPLAEFRAVNVEGTLNLARLAAASGVRRFVFISSIKVNGEQTDDRPPFAPDDVAAPEDPYGVSKHEAEEGLRQIATATGMDVVIVRPPLVYGPGVKGNFRGLLKVASLPIPLPFGAINNRRSLVYLGNLVDFIIHAAQHPAAANHTFLVSDDRDLSTTELLKSIRSAMGRPAWLIPVPGRWLLKATEVIGRAAIGQRLCGSLRVDIAMSRALLGWSPPYTVEQGIADTVAAFRREHLKQ